MRSSDGWSSYRPTGGDVGLHVMAQGRPISELTVKSVIRMWRSGASYREIADILKLSTSTVHKILRHDVDKRCALR